MIPFEKDKVRVNPIITNASCNNLVRDMLKHYGITSKSCGEVVKVSYHNGKLQYCDAIFRIPKAAMKKNKIRMTKYNQRIVFQFNALSLRQGILHVIHKPKKHPLTKIFKNS